MKRIFNLRAYALMVMTVLITFGASAQQYQKAKDTLRGVTKMDTYLFQSASAASKKIIQLPRNSSVLIYGKKGSFFEIKYQNLRGWGVTAAFTIQGIAPPVQEAEPTKIEPEQSVAQTNVRSRNDDRDEILPYRINPLVSYVMKGKDFDKQLRIGVEATYALSKTIGLGAVADAVFIKGTYLDFGPILRTQWTDGNNAFFNPAMYFGLLYYSFDHDGVADSGFGLQWALANDIPIMRGNELQPAISMKAGADMMYFYFDQVRIPFFFSLGAVVRF